MSAPSDSSAKDAVRTGFETAVARLRSPDSGAVETMKVLGLAAMICDHWNRIVLDSQALGLTMVGRVAFPLFAFVLAVNLARSTIDRGDYFMRLVLWGVLTQPIYIWATGSQNLNILITLAVGLQLVRAFETLGAAGPKHDRRSAWIHLGVTLAASLAVDYPLLGPLLVLVLHAWLRRPTVDRGLFVLAVLAALNTDAAFVLPTLAAVAVAWTVALLRPPLPRLRWAFYIVYPGHFAALRLIA